MMLKRSLIIGLVVGAVGCGSGVERLPAVEGATHLVLTVQPSGLSATGPLAVQPVVEVRDANEELVTTGSYPVTITIFGTGSLSFNDDTHTQNGALRLTDLRVSGTPGLRLIFSAPGLTRVVSNPVQ